MFLARLAGQPAALTVLISVLGASAAAQGYRYQEQVGLLPGPVVRTEGSVLIDVDLDGALDLFFANGFVLNIGGQLIAPDLIMNRLAQGMGFVNQSATRLPQPITTLRGTQVLAMDIEQDGDPDLIITCNGPSQQRLWVNDGTGHFTDQSVARLGTLVMSATCAAPGDVDRDGDLDLFINDEATNGQLRLLLNNGLGFFTNVTASHLPVAPKTNQQDINVVDLDLDWDLDVINCGKSAGQQIFLNDGTGHFTVTTALLPAGTASTYETEVADLDQDGDMDIAMLATSGLTDSMIRNNIIPSGTLSFTAMTSFFVGGNGDDDNEFAFVDANDDGLLDVVIGSLQAGAEKLYLNSGTFLFGRQVGVLGFSPVVDSTLDVAVGDLNGDGRLDFVTAQGESGNYTNRVYYGQTLDTQGPRFVRIESLPAQVNSFGPWRPRVVLHDSGVDDMETTVDSVTLNWTVNHRAGSVMGSQVMKTLGGFQWEGTIAPPPGILLMGSTVVWSVTAIDHAGNSTTTPQQEFRVCGAENYGVAGGPANVMNLQISGPLAVGGNATLLYSGAPAFGSGWLGASLERAALPVPNGTIWIDPDFLLALLPLAADAVGSGSFPVAIPMDPAFAGVRLDLQTVFDPPFRLSQGLEIVICP